VRIGVISSSVIPCPPSGYSGLEAIAWHVAEGLAQKGHEVTLFAPEGSWTRHAKLFIFGPAGNWNEASSYDRYWKELPGLDCVVDHGWMKHSYILKAEGVLKAPVLGVLHAPANASYGSPPPVDKPCIVGISKDQATHFEALHNVTVRVAYNGIDLSFYSRLDVPRTDRFLFLARFSSIKGPDLALEACFRASVGLDLVGDVNLTGEPDYYAQCKQLAERQSPGWDANKGKQFRIIGPCSRAETVYYYSKACGFLHLNMRFREPLGLAPLEAMSCGLPVGCWNYGALKETVEDGVTGWRVRSLDEAVHKIKTFQITDEVRQKCRQQAEKFTVEKMVERYDQLCHEAVKEPW